MQLHDLLVGGDRLVVGGQYLGLQVLLQVGDLLLPHTAEVGYDDCLEAVLGEEDGYLGDGVGQVGQFMFDFHRVDVLAARQDDDLLLAPGDVQAPRLVQMTRDRRCAASHRGSRRRFPPAGCSSPA